MAEEQKPQGLSRRGFLKSAGLAAAASGLLVGCGPKAAPEEAAETQAPPVAEAPEGIAKPSFEVSPPPIPAEQIKETLSADVVVVGAGVAGLMAALGAAETGAKVIVLEKSATFNARGGHNAALGSKLQKADGIEYDKCKVACDLARWSGNKADQRLIMLWANNVNQTIDLLIDMAEKDGIVVTTWGNDMPDATWPEYKTVHMFGGMDEKVVAGMVEKAAKEKGVDFHYEMPAAQLLREPGGRVTGVVAGADGSYVQFNAGKGVILCTGDYGNNPEMIARYCPKAADIDFNVYAPAVNTGDGHMMGLWVGAAMQEDTPHTPMVHNLGAPPMASHPFLRVNINAQRYENEDVPIPYMANSIQLQPKNTSWTIFDSTWEEDVPHLGMGFSRSPVVSDNTRKGLEDALTKGALAFRVDTLDELAAKIGVPAEALKATVARYNELADKGVDEDFGKNGEMLTRIDTPPFIAVKNTLALLVVLGGFNCNTKLQVLDTEGNVIPGLYAAGNTVGNFFANDYPVIAPGLSHSRALVFGRLAGQSAVA